jgi:alkylhydroperoxidase family enzyme
MNPTKPHFRNLTLQRLRSVEPERAQGRTKELFETVRQAFGMIPNTARVMANSPAVLESFLAFNSAMAGLKIGNGLHTQVKLATSETNACEYCTSILTVVAPSAGLSAGDILAGRTGDAENLRTRSALAFAHDVLENRGKVSGESLAALRESGFDDTEIVEIVASVVLGCFTNFLNNVADTQLDIPRATPVEACPTSGMSQEACSTH